MLMFTAKGLHRIDSVVQVPTLDSIPVFHQADSVAEKLKQIPANFSAKADSLKGSLQTPLDSVQTKIQTLQNSLVQRLDSLKKRGLPSTGFQKQLDSVEHLSNAPQAQYDKLLALQQKLQEDLQSKLKLDSLASIGDGVKSKIEELNQASAKLGLGTINTPSLNTNLSENISLPANSLPQITTPELNASGLDKAGALDSEIPSTGNVSNLGKNNHEVNIKDAKDKVPGEVGQITEKVDQISKGVGEAGAIVKDAGQYTEELKTIKEEGLASAEKLPELAEQQLMKIDELAAFNQEQANATKQIDQYKDIIEQYKKEKAIEDELIEKTKELATDIILQNSGTVGGAMKKISKYRAKFSDVADMRYLPKHAPNPVKGLGWRERFVPGFTMQTFSTTVLWLEIDPQIYYKLNGSWSAGVGATYRFSMTPNRFSFHDFDNLSGVKIFTQYTVLKGIFLRAEGQYVKWKPYGLYKTDPDVVDEAFIFAFGIGKAYQVSKNIRGNSQVLYHLAWQGADPYKSKFLLRFGFDISLRKKEVKSWERTWKELKHCK